MSATINEKIAYYNMAAESDLGLSADRKAHYQTSLTQAFPLTYKPRRMVPKGFVDFGDDVSFLELYDDWASIPYYELWYERACMALLSPQGILYLLPAILLTVASRPYSREVTQRLIGALASLKQASVAVTEIQYQLIEALLFSPEEACAHGSSELDEEDCFGNKIEEQIAKARKAFRVSGGGHVR